MLYFLQLRVFTVWFSAILEFFSTTLSGVVWPKLSPHHTSFLQLNMQCSVQGVVWSVLSWYIFQDVKANYQCGVYLHVRGRKHASNAYCIFSNQEYSQCNSAQFWTIFSIALSGVVWTKPSPHQTSFLQSHMRCDAVYKLQFGRF